MILRLGIPLTPPPGARREWVEFAGKLLALVVATGVVVGYGVAAAIKHLVALAGGQ